MSPELDAAWRGALLPLAGQPLPGHCAVRWGADIFRGPQAAPGLGMWAGWGQSPLISGGP